ncbi:excisionase family DNA-binding protein [Pseudalkalibacillus salsuginis]|uniref:excisionase family DNA-binding protein n=1 Tax=Pseudalkalibacillus salsuginis TaxID=2910972 RepID=UPI001F36966D|nr:excisionase family DNA-binding protein [Pseudalkalibacillus salsuginis]MCF6411499.1 excisionase family DNA-binding protein [Pseudalkalibacillus salsuginis]
MDDVRIDEKTVNNILEEAINKHVEELARQKYFLTYSELSKYLNISKPIIEDRLIKNGLKYYKVGCKYLFKKNEVDAFLDEITANMNIRNNDLKFFNKLQNNMEIFKIQEGS